MMQKMMQKILISFDNVRFCYDEICAVEGVSFAIEKNEAVALIGPNGGGKSTILKLMAGVLRPESGRIYRNSSGNESGGVGYVGQNADFDTSFPITVGELVLMGTLGGKIIPYKRYTAAQKDMAKAALKKVGLWDLADRSIAQLSGGQLKRAVIARALACDSGVIVLDEPDASLDADASAMLFSLLKSLTREVSVVLVSHNYKAALDIADRAIYVNKKAVVFGDPGDLRKRLEGGILL